MNPHADSVQQPSDLLTIWRGECEAAEAVVRNGEKFLLLPEASLMVIGSAIEQAAEPSQSSSEAEDREAFTTWYDKRDGIRNSWTAWQAGVAHGRKLGALSRQAPAAPAEAPPLSMSMFASIADYHAAVHAQKLHAPTANLTSAEHQVLRDAIRDSAEVVAEPVQQDTPSGQQAEPMSPRDAHAACSKEGYLWAYEDFCAGYMAACEALAGQQSERPALTRAQQLELADFLLNAKRATREEVEAEVVTDEELAPMVAALHKKMAAMRPAGQAVGALTFNDAVKMAKQAGMRSMGDGLWECTTSDIITLASRIVALAASQASAPVQEKQ